MHATTTPAIAPLNLPRLGLGTWRMGDSQRRQSDEVAAVRLAIEFGYRLIDTAEMYGEGGAETVVGRAVADALRAGDVTRDALCIVSKVYPHNASRDGVPQACARSLARLGLDHIDLYLLHWRGAHPLAETADAFEQLVAERRIVRWGVSNFDTADMVELFSLPAGRACAANQVYFSLGERGAAHDLLPWLREHGVPLMAYSPIDQGALAQADALRQIGKRHDATAAQVALAWVLAQPGVVAIPKAVQATHLRENWAATQISLDADDLSRLDQAYPPPRRKRPLAMT